MLCSHSKKFIFLKTVKTAGTSVERFFEEYCLPSAGAERPDSNAEYIGPTGIVGERGPKRQSDPQYFSHMKAADVKSALDEKIWSEYHKFTTIRNPFDKVVSWFWFNLTSNTKDQLRHADFQNTRAHFHNFLRTNPLPIDRAIYMIGSKIAVDSFVKFEALSKDINRVCNDLFIHKTVDQLGHFKSKERIRNEPFQDYYDKDTQRYVAESFAFELDYFSYQF